jgi:predicted NBD/HSP70 family sugar kinase
MLGNLHQASTSLSSSEPPAAEPTRRADESYRGNVSLTTRSIPVGAVFARFYRNERKEVASSTERLVLDLVRRSGSMSRADLTRACGLSGPGAKALIDSLVARGLLQLGAPATKGRGQPSASVSLVPHYAYCFGLAIRVDGYSLALIDFTGQCISIISESAFPLQLGQVAERASLHITTMLQTQGITPDSVFGVGLSMTGPHTGQGSRVNPPLSMPSEWASTELDQFFAQQLQLPVWLDNDANCAAIGEALLGIGRQVRNFVYLHFTDGFASGVVQDGNIARGAHGNSGELGRLYALAGMPRLTLEELRLSLVAAGHDLPDLQSMLSHYDPQWPEIDTWIASVSKGLTITVAAIVALLDPQLIVFGARLPKDLAERLIASVEFEQAPRRGTPAPNPLLVAAKSTQDCAVLGAANLPLKEHFFL